MSNMSINEIAVSQQAVVMELFVAALPFRKEIGNHAFRLKVMNTARGVMNPASVPVFYNSAKKESVKQGLTENFGRGFETKIDKRKDVDPALLEQVDSLLETTLAIVLGNETIALKTGLKWKIVTRDGKFKTFVKTKKAGVSLAKEGDQVLKVA